MWGAQAPDIMRSDGLVAGNLTDFIDRGRSKGRFEANGTELVSAPWRVLVGIRSSRCMVYASLSPGRLTSAKITSENSSGTQHLAAVRCSHLVPNRTSDSALERRIRFACCWMMAGATALVGFGCANSPRAEYLQTRAIEVKPTNEGDGTTLAQRDGVMRGNLAGATAVIPLAAVKTDTSDTQQ